MVTKRLFIEETTEGKTGLGTREIWEIDDATMAELGWQRIADTTQPQFNDDVRTYVRPVSLALDHDDPPIDRLTGEARVNGALKPCPVHTTRVFSLCSSCRSWAER